MRKVARLLSALALAIGASCADGTAPVPQAPIAAPEASIGASKYFSCALNSSGRAFCWGANDVGQLGTGTTDDADGPTPVATSDAYRTIQAGDPGGCALTFAGVAQCWGQSREHMQPVSIVSPVAFTQVSTSGSTSCGLTADGAAYCWGSNVYGQLGTYSTRPSADAVPVMGGLTFASVSVGLLHTCGLTTAGTAYCWGYNAYGALGNGTQLNSLGPTQVTGGVRFRMLSAGSNYTCGIAVSGAAYCWGLNASRQLGEANGGNTVEPVPVANGMQFASIHAGAGSSIFMPTCAITTAGDAYCWGMNDKGQTGSTSAMDCVDTAGQPMACAVAPTRVPGLSNVIAIVPGVQHTCAMIADRRMFCWGDNARGELGNGTQVASVSPAAVRPF